MYRTINCCQGGSAYRRKSCDRRFKRRPQNPNQQYCYRKICQNKRCRAGVAPPFFSDLAYRDNQLDSQERSLEKWLIYWRQYRERNAEYVAGNRRLQRALDQPKRDLEHKRSVLIGGGVWRRNKPVVLFHHWFGEVALHYSNISTSPRYHIIYVDIILPH